MTDHQSQAVLSLGVMPQLTEARDSDDDWTGLTDAASRRRRQTRLNTRAYRRRKALASKGAAAADKVGAGRPATVPQSPEASVPCWSEDSQSIVMLPAAVARQLVAPENPVIPPKHRRPSSIMFPLSPDHLMIVTQFNFFRACSMNSKLVSAFSPNHPYDCTKGALKLLPGPSDCQYAPPSLLPTKTQSEVAHGVWVDVFPDPTWRDNIINAAGTFSEKELLMDAVGRLFKGTAGSESERRDILVWNPPWHISGWEFSEGFLRKWGWMLRGCDDVLATTNMWRSLRGEEPLTMEL